MNFFGWGAMEEGKNIRVSQLLAVIIIIAALIIIAYRRIRLKVPMYSDPVQPRISEKRLTGQIQ